MKKILPSSNRLKFIVCLLLCLAVIISVPCLAANVEGVSAEKEDKPLLRIWQIDNFEGGKGSRADFLQQVGNKFSKSDGAFVTVTSISADAAKANLAAGNRPDLISFGAGICGIETYLKNYATWCRGGYCIITLNGDFSDVSGENLVINPGKDNLTQVAALFCGFQQGKIEKSTSAYVKLINGEYKYLLGTQRDVFRLRTRGESYKIKPVTQFNDLYQNISVIAEGDKGIYADRYVQYLKSQIKDVSKLGLFSDGLTLYDDDLRVMEEVAFEYKLSAPLSESKKNEIENAISSGDINTLKTLFK